MRLNPAMPMLAVIVELVHGELLHGSDPDDFVLSVFDAQDGTATAALCGRQVDKLTQSDFWKTLLWRLLDFRQNSTKQKIPILLTQNSNHLSECLWLRHTVVVHHQRILLRQP